MKNCLTIKKEGDREVYECNKNKQSYKKLWKKQGSK